MKKCSNLEECPACPFNYTSEESQLASNYGCLPSPKDIIEIFEKTNNIWACHDNPEVPCKGAINYLKNKNLSNQPIKYNKLEHDWSVHGIEYDKKNYISSYLKIGSLISILINNEKITLKVLNLLYNNETILAEVIDVYDSKNINILTTKITINIKEIIDIHLLGSKEYKKYHNRIKE